MITGGQDDEGLPPFPDTEGRGHRKILNPEPVSQADGELVDGGVGKFWGLGLSQGQGEAWSCLRVHIYIVPSTQPSLVSASQDPMPLAPAMPLNPHPGFHASLHLFSFSV